MPGQLALILCAIGVASLYYLNRDTSVKTSKASWISVIWLALIGSRPVSVWFGITPPAGPSANLDGSPVDAAVFALLLVVGIAVLAVRKRVSSAYLAVLTPILIYYGYCLLSVSWSPVPLASIKRWIKDVGDVVMVLVIATDAQPVSALRRLYSRVGFIIFPFSITLIRYTTMGRAWNNDGLLSNVGVTTDKNMFGLIVFVISLGTLWQLRWLWMNPGAPNRSRRLVALSILLACGVYLLSIAHSSTSIACFCVGSSLMLATHLSAIKRRPSRVYLLGMTVFVLGGLAIAGGGAGDVASSLGRDSTFSGRTVIWAALLPTVSNPVIGTGFDSFWNSPSQLMFAQTLNSSGWYHAELLNEAHDGYLEVYLNLGWLGIACLLAIILTGYSQAGKALGRDREVGSLAFAYIVAGMLYSITEAGFRTLSPMWLCILLAVVTVSGTNAGLFRGQPCATDISNAQGRRPWACAPNSGPDIVQEHWHWRS